MRVVLRFEGLEGCEVLVLGYVVLEVGHFGLLLWKGGIGLLVAGW